VAIESAPSPPGAPGPTAERGDVHPEPAQAGVVARLSPPLAGFLVGVVAALLATLVLAALKALTVTLTLWRLEHPLLVLLVPALGGLLVGLGRRWWASDFASTLAGRLPDFDTSAGQFALALGTVLSGGVAGREEPVIGFVAALSRRLSLALRQRMVSLPGAVAAACAGGLAVAFGAPFAGLVFACELVAGRPRGADLVAVLVAAGGGALAGRLTGLAVELPVGNAPAQPGGWLVVLGVALAALIAGLALAALIGLLLQALRRVGAPLVLAPAVGGLIVGLLTLVSPAFAGTDPLAPALLREEVTALWLLTAAGRAASLIATLGFGGVGGVIAPVVGTGQALGAGMGALLDPFLPGNDPPTLALIGGMVTLATVVRTPFATALLALEAGADPLLVVALAILGWGAAALARVVEPWSVYRLLAPEPETPRGALAVPLLSTTLVRDVMVPASTTLAPGALAAEAVALVRQVREELPVVDGRGMLVGVLSPADAERALILAGPEALALDYARREFPTVLLYQTLDQALQELGSESVTAIPVVDPREPGKLVGLLRYRQVLDLLGLAPPPPHSAAPTTPGQDDGLPVLRIPIPAGSPWAGKRVRELRLPSQAFPAVIARGERRLPWRGESLLREGDVVLGFAPPAVAAELLRQAAGEGGPSDST
jgi:CIC family chloride channel protein